MKINNALGLRVNLHENGAIESIIADQIRISLKPATLYSKLGANIFLRKRSNPLEFIPLIGPQSNSFFEIYADTIVAKGKWKGISYKCGLILSHVSFSWEWQVELENNTDHEDEFDLIYLQDIGLKPSSETSINEYYVAQYIERIVLVDHEHGSVICCRQNMKGPTGNPWVMLASGNSAISACTDGMQFYGKSYKETGIPEALVSDFLGGEYAGESSIVALQERPFYLAPGRKHRSSFIGSFIADHQQASSQEDLKKLPELFDEFDHADPSKSLINSFSPLRNFFNTSPFLPVDDLTAEELESFFGNDWRHAEKDNGRLISFFYNQNSHVILRPKEKLVDRPHGHIMQAKGGYVPDENIMSTTSYAYGVFNSHLTQGNTNFNIFLSVSSSQFNLNTETGQRIFVEIDGDKYLLGVPSAFEMGLNHCRWIYKYGDICLQVRTWTSRTFPQINLDIKPIKGSVAKLLITHHFDESNDWNAISSNSSYAFQPKVGSLIANKFPNAQFKILVQKAASAYQILENPRNDLFLIEVKELSSFCMSFIGEVCSSSEYVKIDNSDQQWLNDYEEAQRGWQDLALSLSIHGGDENIEAINEILPWFSMNALTHFLTPHGLEQFGGAAWGTRDVSQGPIDLLLQLGKYEAARKVLCIIFSNQNGDGGWPQWWMFDSYTNIRAHEAHGDIFYWCIIALSNYIKVTGDLSILDEGLPFYHDKGKEFAEKATLNDHVERLINMIVKSFIKGKSLVPYGGGDWNDSLQPASKDLANRMISSWTVEMNYQAFLQYSRVYDLLGNSEKAKILQNICDQIKSDFNKYLVKDDVVAGYGLVEDNGAISVMLHPSDDKTGIHYSVLPMERGVLSEIFSSDQAAKHLNLIEKHLKGPDGIRLMDRPLKYQGGIQSIFQRAESSTFFGREIGLVYIHEHIRYAESLAIMGRADAFVRALRQANPVGYQSIVEQGDIRQSNCYYSSSDVIFKNRYEADKKYIDVINGKYTLRGGWRVYSSGPGIYVGIVIGKLLGLRVEYDHVIIDPVMPFVFDGTTAQLDFLGKSIKLKYIIKDGEFSPKLITINGRKVDFRREQNAYREGGAAIGKTQFLDLLDSKNNFVEVYL